MNTTTDQAINQATRELRSVKVIQASNGYLVTSADAEACVFNSFDDMAKRLARYFLDDKPKEPAEPEDDKVYFTVMPSLGVWSYAHCGCKSWRHNSALGITKHQQWERNQMNGYFDKMYCDQHKPEGFQEGGHIKPLTPGE
jgi:hypothetical protein